MFEHVVASSRVIFLDGWEFAMRLLSLSLPFVFAFGGGFQGWVGGWGMVLFTVRGWRNG